MRALEVSLNGKKLFVAGLEDGALTAMVCLVDRMGETDDFLDVRGTNGPMPGISHQWGMQFVGVGDAITIRIVETDTIDAPKVKRPVADYWPEKKV